MNIKFTINSHIIEYNLYIWSINNGQRNSDYTMVCDWSVSFTDDSEHLINNWTQL